MSDTEKPTKVRRRKKNRHSKKQPKEEKDVEMVSPPDSEPDIIVEEQKSPDNDDEDSVIQEIRIKFINSVFSRINDLKHEVFTDATNDLIQDIADYIHKTEEDEALDEILDDSWKRGLSPKEVKHRTQQIKDLLKVLDQDLPSVAQILDSDITDSEKGKAIQMYDILNSVPRFSIEYKVAKAELLNTLGKHETLSPEELQKCKETEERLNQTKSNKMTIKQRIYLSNHGEENMQILHDMANRLDAMPPNDSEYAGLKEIIDTALSLPVGKSIKPTVGPDAQPEEVVNFLINLRQIFDTEIFGMHDVKDYIMEIIGSRISNPNTLGDVIAFEGPPGTGKTLFVKCIAKAMGLPYDIITLAGAHDPSYIEGFLSTYSKSTYGRLIGALRKIQCDNGIILWDEADKIDESRATAVSGPLIVIFDPEQNTKFKDKFLGDISMDVSKLLHCITMNDRKHVNFIAANRMNIITIRPPTLQEKVGATKLKIIPEAIEKAGLAKEDVVIDDNVIEYTITKSSIDEPGLRHHKRNFERIFKRINVLKRTTLPDGTTGNLKLNYNVGDFRIPLNVTKKVVDQLFNENQEEKQWQAMFS